MCIWGVHFLRRQSRKPLVASARTAGHGLALSTWGKSSPMKFNNVTGAHLDTNTAHYLHLKNSALTRRLAEDPAQGRQMNSRKGGAEGLCFSRLPMLKGKKWKDWKISHFNSVLCHWERGNAVPTCTATCCSESDGRKWQKAAISDPGSPSGYTWQSQLRCLFVGCSISLPLFLPQSNFSNSSISLHKLPRRLPGCLLISRALSNTDYWDLSLICRERLSTLLTPLIYPHRWLSSHFSPPLLIFQHSALSAAAAALSFLQAPRCAGCFS